MNDEYELKPRKIESIYGPMQQESVRLPENAIEYLMEEGKRLGLGKSTMIRYAVMQWIEQRNKDDNSQTG